jgi:hypothetical protein
MNRKDGLYPSVGKTSCTPGLFWSYEVFREVKNSLGTFVESNMIFLQIVHMTIVHILIGFNLKEGLDTKMVVQNGNHSI